MTDTPNNKQPATGVLNQQISNTQANNANAHNVKTHDAQTNKIQTDNEQKTGEQKTGEQNDDTKVVESIKPVTNTNTKSFNTNGSSTNQQNSPSSIKKVMINIAGSNYPIHCPAEDEKELLKAEAYINDFINDIKKNAPHLNSENLLVLCCLNLYEKINAQQQADTLQKKSDQQINILINKLIKDAQAITG